MYRPLLKVSNSDIVMFKRCKRKWTLASFNRRNLTSHKPNLKLWLGTGGHYALQHWDKYGGEFELLEAFQGWADDEIGRLREALGSNSTQAFWNEVYKTIDLGIAVLSHYKGWAEKNDKFKMVATEYEVSVPIPGTVICLTTPREDLIFPPDIIPLLSWVVTEWGENYEQNEDFKKTYIDKGLYDAVNKTIPALFVGRLDGVVEQDGYNYVIDHKFMAKAIAEEMLLIDEQTSKYVWAARVAIENGWWPILEKDAILRGAMYNVILKKVPKIPEVVSTGRTSKKKIKTTREIFERTLMERGEDIADFESVLCTLPPVEEAYFRRHPIYRSQRELDMVGQRLYHEYTDMAEVAASGVELSNPRLYPSPTRDCGWECPFNGVCYIANYGGDAEFTIRESFKTSDRTYYVSPDVEPEAEDD